MEAPKQDFNQSLTKIDEDEKLLAVIKRHPFGIIRLYFIILVGLGAAAALIFYLMPQFVDPNDSPATYSFVALLAVLVVVIMLVIAGIATVIYNQSSLTITDKTITQTIQVGLFSKKTSQLAVSSVEDVTANKNGFFPTLFNYGRLLIETAGEQENFHFDYCPHADHYAKLVLETRQQFMGNRETEYLDQRRATSAAVPGPTQATTASSPSNVRAKADSKLLGDLAIDGPGEPDRPADIPE